MEKILSILIPTRNRQIYLENVIKTILKFKSNEFELIIQDNSNKLESKLNNLDDNRLVYNYISDEISFSENFEMGLNLCSGDYICIIGDDDGINPEIIEFAHYLKTNDIESVSFNNLVSYFWPGIPGLTNDYHGILQIGNIKCLIEKFDVKEEIDKLLNNGGQNYLKYGLPKLYHGIVKKTTIEKVIRNYGRCFDSLSPDIFSTIKLSELIKEVYTTDYPFTIAGSCSNSASAASMTKKHEGKLKDAPHFRGFQNYIWSDYVPPFYSVETIWAESLVFAYKDNSNKLEKFNISKLLEICFINHPKYRVLVKDFARQRINKSQFLNFYVKSILTLIRKFLKRIFVRIKIILRLSKYTKNNQIPNIGLATDYLLEKQKYNRYNYTELIQNFEELRNERKI